MDDVLEMDLPDSLLAPAWRNLCAGLIVQAACRVEDEHKLIPQYRSGSKQAMLEKATARKWLEGEPDAVITFEEACESIGVDPDAIKEAILERAKDRKRLPCDPRRPTRIQRPPMF